MVNIKANVNTDNGVGTWTINESVNIQLQLFGYEIGANNSIKKVLIKDAGFTETGYVLNKGQLFSITSLDIDDIIENSGEFTKEEIQQTKEILGGVFLTTIPTDKNKKQINTSYKFKILKT